jgi:hypothetical protein
MSMRRNMGQVLLVLSLCWAIGITVLIYAVTSLQFDPQDDPLR